jgi:hypothetical protein
MRRPITASEGGLVFRDGDFSPQRAIRMEGRIGEGSSARFLGKSPTRLLAVAPALQRRPTRHGRACTAGKSTTNRILLPADPPLDRPRVEHSW